MTYVVQNTQVILLATILLAACAAKLTIREPRRGTGTHVHGVPVHVGTVRPARHRHSALTVGVAVTEGVLGVALLVTAHPAARWATVAAFAVATWVVGDLRVRRPDAGCGCFGGLSRKRVGKRSVARAALLTVAALGGVQAPLTGIAALGSDWATAALLVIELAVIAALSPELGTLVGRHRSPEPCELRRSRLAETYATLRSSEVWRQHQQVLLADEPMDVWREGCRRYLTFPASVDDQRVTLVFAVSTQERHRTVRAALVVEEEPGEPAYARPQRVVTV